MRGVRLGVVTPMTQSHTANEQQTLGIDIDKVYDSGDPQDINLWRWLSDDMER